MTFAADAFFDFDKAVLKPEGKAKLDDLVGKIEGINLEVIIAVGHTDSVGTDAYNQKLSVRRAEAVKAYLVSKGVEKNRVYTEGKGEKQPVADNKTAEGRAKNRRVEIEVVGTRANTLTSALRWHCKKPRFGGAFCLCRFDGAFIAAAIACHDRMTSTPTRRNSPSSASSPTAGGIRKAIPAAARDQPAAPGLDRSASRRCDGKRVLDVGCGGGILAEAMARTRRRGAGHRPGDQAAARWRSCTRWRPARRNVEYREVAAEALAAEQPGAFDVVTCMEMLEHVPDPASVVRACAAAGQAGRLGVLLHDQPQSQGLPVRHRRRRARAEAAAPGHARVRRSSSARASWRAGAAPPGSSCVDTRGMEYNPLTRRYWLSGDTSVNYLFAMPEAGMMRAAMSRRGAVRSRRHADRQRARPRPAAANDARRRAACRRCRSSAAPDGRRRRARHGRRGLRHRRPSDAGYEALRDEFFALRERMTRADLCVRRHCRARSPQLLEPAACAWGMVTNKATRFTAAAARAWALFAHAPAAVVVRRHDAALQAASRAAARGGAAAAAGARPLHLRRRRRARRGGRPGRRHGHRGRRLGLPRRATPIRSCGAPMPHPFAADLLPLLKLAATGLNYRLGADLVSTWVRSRCRACRAPVRS